MAFWPERGGAGIVDSQTTMITILRTSKALTNSDKDQKDQDEEESMLFSDVSILSVPSTVPPSLLGTV